MTSPNVLQPINCNVRDIDGPTSKRIKIDATSKTKPSHETKSNRWSLSNRQNELHSLAEMGLGMLETDEVIESSDTKIEIDYSQPSCSRVDYELNDTNPEFISLPGECISNSSTSNDSDECSTSNKPCSSENIDTSEKRKELSRESKSWDDFCIYRRASMTSKDMKDWFTYLSDEIILMIFKWLPKVSLVSCALVCKKWYALTTDETLWTRLDVSMNVLSPGAIGHILSRQVLVLRMAQSEILDPPILPGVKAAADDFAAKLMYLDLSMATISTEGLTMLLSKCNRLKKLSLEACTVDYDVCAQLATNRHLETLNMSNVEGLAEDGVEVLLKSCISLKELNIAWTLLSISCLDIICRKMPTGLSRLNISGCRKTLNNLHVKKLVNRCPRLTELDLSDCTALTNEVIRDIIQLQKLNFLALSRCYAIQCAGLMRLVHCKSLTYLDIHGGHIEQRDIEEVQRALGNGVQLNKFLFSSVARPTVGMKRSSIWGLRVRD